ncbi:MAG TPA: DegT/DnrJ/EryC1/StrS family aminotransferase [Pyrinomonadaceae bacterium]
MSIQVPFFRPQVGEAEVEEVVDTLRSGWLTSGPKVTRFEQEFAARVGASHAVAVNSCTAALHLALEALNLRPRQAVLVPTMTFAATAEVVRYQGAFPLLVDCDPQTGNMSMEDAARKLARLRAGEYASMHGAREEVSAVGIIPVHVGGLMMDTRALLGFAEANGLWVVEDAAHAFPAACRSDEQARWQTCGEATAAVSCFSFYANKTITTGEGGMATTDDDQLAARMRSMSLHGLSHDAWRRYSGGGSWDYQIIAPGYKYNLTDIAAAIGIHQLARADRMRDEREQIAAYYLEQFAGVEELELPTTDANRIHAWHLFPVRLRLDRLRVSRNEFIEELKRAGVGCSVHWRPLHLHPYYRETFGWRPEEFPSATETWERLLSLPIFPGMREDELAHVVKTVRNLCARNSKAAAGIVSEEASVAIS